MILTFSASWVQKPLAGSPQGMELGRFLRSDEDKEQFQGMLEKLKSLADAASPAYRIPRAAESSSIKPPREFGSSACVRGRFRPLQEQELSLRATLPVVL